MTETYTAIDVRMFRKRYNLTDPRTWPFFPVIMPSRDGEGPVNIDECDAIAFEVWDWFCMSHESFSYLSDAITKAMILNLELFKEPS